MSNAEALSAEGDASPEESLRESVRARPRKRRTQADRSDETRSRVIEAAAKVLRKKGYAGLRTDEVSRVAKVSRGAQQYHFRTKDSLVLATAEHLLRTSLQRGLVRVEHARTGGDAIDAIIEDCFEFFLGPDFTVILDLVLAGSKDSSLRGHIYAYSRESRFRVEEAWLEVLCERGVPRETARKALWLTISIVRGFSVRALWQNDQPLFRELTTEWKQILAQHLKQWKGVRE